MNPALPHILLQIAAALYFLSMAGYGLFLFNQRASFQKMGFGLIAGAVLAHMVSIAVYIFDTGHAPVQNLSQNLSLAAWVLGGMFLYFHLRFKLKILGLYASVLISVIMLAVLLLPQNQVETNALLKGFWFYSHIIFIFAGYAALALASGAGILYLLQESGIKSKNPGFFFRRLPSLDLLDSVGYTSIATGFALLTIGLVTGFIYAKSVWGSFWSSDIKEIFSVVIWVVYAALLHLRLNAGWRGRKSAVVTIIGFAIIIFTFLGVNILLGGHHQEFTR